MWKIEHDKVLLDLIKEYNQPYDFEKISERLI